MEGIFGVRIPGLQGMQKIFHFTSDWLYEYESYSFYDALFYGMAREFFWY